MQRRYQGLSAETQRILDQEGETGRFEFKQDAENGVKVSVLVAAANAAALEGIPSVTILVGVEEREYEETGVVTGHVVGLRDLERAKELITGRGRSVRPVPPNVLIIEENVKTARPILRVVVSPTRAPHYDDHGARATRQGASTRALTDEELLDMFLLREAASFRQRFQEIASEIEYSIGEVADQARELATQLNSIESATDQLQGSVDETYEFVGSVLEGIGDVQQSVESLVQAPETMEGALSGLLGSREMAKACIRLRSEIGDPKRRPPAKERQVIEELANHPPVLLAYRRNLRELNLWRSLVTTSMDAPTKHFLRIAELIRDVQAEPEA